MVCTKIKCFLAIRSRLNFTKSVVAYSGSELTLVKVKNENIKNVDNVNIGCVHSDYASSSSNPRSNNIRTLAEIALKARKIIKHIIKALMFFSVYS